MRPSARYLLVLSLTSSAFAATSSAPSSSKSAPTPPPATPAAPSPAGAITSQPTVQPTTDNPGGVPPLTGYRFPFDIRPEQVDPFASGRGPQSGYNLCNSTTEGPTSNCQTAFINNIADFCLWGPPTPDSTIGDTEAATVAWCTKKGHGTRVMPSGTLTAVQVLHAPGYIEVVGRYKGENINIKVGDAGGEMDPFGADLRGNPLGGLVYSNFQTGNNNTYNQIVYWNNFVSTDTFCFKACYHTDNSGPGLCENRFDTEGCGYNAPAAYAPGVFEVCDSDNQVTAGTTPTDAPAPIPASSNCVQYQSTDLYGIDTSVHTSTAVSSGGSPTKAASSSSASQTQSASSTGHALSLNVGLIAGSVIAGLMLVVV